MDRVNTIIVIGTLLVYSASFTKTFLLSDPCIAPSCTCSGTYVYCQRKSFVTVPQFVLTDQQIANITILLSYNHLTTIPDSAFVNVGNANAKLIKLELQGNKINSMDANAFMGIEHATYDIDLHKNNLTCIPSALGRISALLTLNLQDNPIHSLDPATMSNIGHSLTTLYISLDHVTSWPTEFYLLQNLVTLTVDKIPFRRINDTAFHGLETTLTTLKITNSRLFGIPLAVCDLVQLQNLILNYNRDLSPYIVPYIVPQCQMRSVTSLNLASNMIPKFPDVFGTFPSLTVLSLTLNEIHSIDAAMIPSNSNLTYLIMNYNRFTSIPVGINKFKHLTKLQMASNRLLTIGDNDLTGLEALVNLFLYYNKDLRYVAPNAFVNNTHLRSLDLAGTKLRVIPSAVMAIRNLTDLYLGHDDLIHCTCYMSYLKPWNVTSVRIYGTCASSTQSLQDFILKSLPQCP